MIRVRLRPIAVTLSSNLRKEETILEMCPDIRRRYACQVRVFHSKNRHSQVWGRLANKTGVLDNNACRILRAYARIIGDWAMWFRSGCPGHSQPELRHILHQLRCAWAYFEKPVTTVKQV